MKKLVTTICAAFALISGNAQELLSKDALNQKLTYFYQNPDSGTLHSIINTIRLDKQVREAFPPPAILGFCTGVLLSRNPNSRILKSELEKHRTEVRLFEAILFFGQTQDTLIHWPEHSAEMNDVIWAAYFGTGETKYLDRLLTETRYKDREDSLQLFFAGSSAMWSLASNARQHPSIKEYLNKLSSSVNDAQKKANLQEILTRDPNEFREETVTRIKSMKERGLLQPQPPAAEPYQLKLVKKPTGALLGLSSSSNTFSIEVEGKEIKAGSDPGYYTVDGKFLQVVTIQIPGTADLQNLTPEKEEQILRGYVDYELTYFRNELKLKVRNESIKPETINGKLFIRWSFAADPPTTEGITSPKRHIYYSTVCFDRVLSMSSATMPKENAKAPDTMLRAIAKTLKLFNEKVEF